MHGRMGSLGWLVAGKLVIASEFNRDYGTEPKFPAAEYRQYEILFHAA